LWVSADHRHTFPVILVFAFFRVDPASSDLFIGQSFMESLVPIVGGWDRRKYQPIDFEKN